MSPGSSCLWLTVWDRPTFISSLTPSSQSAPQGPPSEPLGLGKSLDDRICTSSSSHILAWIFACSLLCCSQLSEKNTKVALSPLSHSPLLPLKKKKAVLFIFHCPRSVVLSTFSLVDGSGGALWLRGPSLQCPLCCRVGSGGHAFQ